MNNISPLVSVVIPCYNAERFLAETVECVFQQTFKDYEIILVDDGSRDNTAEIIKAFGEKVHAVFGSNAGVSAARNRGTQLAKGEFIQYIDADDLLLPDALEKRVRALIQSNADVAYSDWQKLEEFKPGEFIAGETVVRRIEDIHPIQEIAIFTTFWAPPVALLYRRSLVARIGGWNETLPVIEDARFLLDACLVGGKFIYVPGITAYYRIHNGISLSRSDSARFFKYCYLNACEIEAYWLEQGGLNVERYTALTNVYTSTAINLFMLDPKLFTDNVDRLYQLTPQFDMTFPKIMSKLSDVLGYKRAKFLLVNYRKISSSGRNLYKMIMLFYSSARLNFRGQA